MAKTLKSILVVKVGAIGDLVMTLPMLLHLRTQHPSAIITWICGETVAPLLKATSLVDKLIIINEKKLLKGTFKERLISLSNIWIKLFLRKFDLVITAHPDPRYRILSLFAWKKAHHFFSYSKSRPFPLPGRYQVNEYMRLVNPIEGCDAPSPIFPKLSLPQINHYFNSHPLVIIAPGGAKNVLADDALRRWPIEYYKEVANQLNKHSINLIIIGSESDRWVEPHFTHIAHTNLIGKLDLMELVSLLQKATLLITHDSGPLHLSKLSNCQTIALFGPTNPTQIAREKNIHIFWEGKNLPCSPCYFGKNYAPCTNNLCLSKIQPARIIKKALEIIFPNVKPLYIAQEMPLKDCDQSR